MSQLLNRSTQHAIYIVCCVLFILAILLSACVPTATPTYFIPPTAPPRLILNPTNGGTPGGPGQTEATVVAFSTSTPLILDLNATPTLEATEATPSLEPTLTCTNSLKFLEDITIPDGTVMSAGESFVKQWRIQNDGTCDWDSNYVLKLVSGDALGGPTETALYPARAGAEAVIEMTLTAPQQAGAYHTVWQAIAPDGSAFEQAIYVDFAVQ